MKILKNFVLGSLIPAFTDDTVFLTIGTFILNWYSIGNFFFIFFGILGIINRFEQTRVIQ